MTVYKTSKDVRTLYLSWPHSKSAHSWYDAIFDGLWKEAVGTSTANLETRRHMLLLFLFVVVLWSCVSLVVLCCGLRLFLCLLLCSSPVIDSSSTGRLCMLLPIIHCCAPDRQLSSGWSAASLWWITLVLMHRTHALTHIHTHTST